MAPYKKVTREIPGKGFVKCVAILEPSASDVKCYRVGGVPYAEPVLPIHRWKRAQPLPQNYQYGTQERPADFTGLSNVCPQPDPRETAASEDCLQCNIWIPAGEAPREGWPVFFYIHGGFLQWGSPNRENPAALLSETPIRCIIVAPGYRLNVFGFLASRELAAEASSAGDTYGNLGFWDQRLALEWTHANIGFWGGNPSNITVGGLSAGAYSSFHQLAYEIGLPDDAPARIIRRVIMWSNGCGLQPKPLSELQPHFNSLLKVLDIPLSLPDRDKLARLRLTSTKTLSAAVRRLPENYFRAVTDGRFVRPTLIDELRSGSFGSAMARRGIKLLIGEVRDERNSYRNNSPPDSYHGLIARLAVEYPIAASQRLAQLYCPAQTTGEYKTWKDLWGRLYADVQVHASERGLLHSLLLPHTGLTPNRDIFRYRIEWRPRCVDESYPPYAGVAHGSDLSVWFFGNNSLRGLESETEKPAVREFLLPLRAFLEGRDAYLQGERWLGGGSDSERDVRSLRLITPDQNGKWQLGTDADWERGVRVWSVAVGSGGPTETGEVEGSERRRESKL